jgi:hypothetical protein
MIYNRFFDFCIDYPNVEFVNLIIRDNYSLARFKSNSKKIYARLSSNGMYNKVEILKVSEL